MEIRVALIFQLSKSLAPTPLSCFNQQENDMYKILVQSDNFKSTLIDHEVLKFSLKKSFFKFFLNTRGYASRHTSCAYYASEHTMLPKNNKLKYPNQTMQTIIAMEQKLETLVRFTETRWQHFISAIEEIIFENRNYLGK